MSLEIGLFAYAGVAAVALGTHQHRRLALPYVGTLQPGTARTAGVVLIVLSLVAALASFGSSQGIVAWIGVVCVAGLCLVLLLSRWPRGALLAAPVFAAFAVLAMSAHLLKELTA